MSNYVVWWGMYIDDVADPVEAAEQAQLIMQEPGKIWGYKVVDSDTGEEFEVSLYETVNKVKPYGS